MFSLANIKRNWHAGLTVALISIPLSISLAITSKATPLMGIITAVWAGLIAALFGGSNYNIVGPTGALADLVGVFAITYGIAALPTLAILTGVFIGIAYYFRLDRMITYIPNSAVHGFTLGVALIIGLGQINFAFGLHTPPQCNFFDGVMTSLADLPNLSFASLFTTFIFLGALLLVWIRMTYMPPLVFITPLGLLFGLIVNKADVGFHLDTIGTKFGAIHAELINFPTWTASYHMIMPAIAVTIIALLETLVSAKIADQMTKTTHDPRRELIGLSLANIASGLCGGIPATAALARTSVNIKSGATSRIAGVISSVCIALIALFLLPWFAYMPLAVVAAMLIFIAVRMIERDHFEVMWNTERFHFWLALAVALVSVVEDPVIGIFFGTAASFGMDQWKKNNLEK